MSYELTDEDKAIIIQQQLKNLEYSIFNAELSIVQENAVSSPDTEDVASLTSQLSDLRSKKTALLAELSKLTLGA